MITYFYKFFFSKAQVFLQTVSLLLELEEKSMYIFTRLHGQTQSIRYVMVVKCVIVSFFVCNHYTTMMTQICLDRVGLNGIFPPQTWVQTLFVCGFLSFQLLISYCYVFEFFCNKRLEHNTLVTKIKELTNGINDDL